MSGPTANVTRAQTCCPAQGVRPRIVQERLGHANMDTVMELYPHLVPGMQEEASMLAEALRDNPQLRNTSSGA